MQNAQNDMRMYLNVIFEIVKSEKYPNISIYMKTKITAMTTASFTF